ncbi:hypothetical protein Rmet_3366 [Cupriavidus metallidurans CH34]|uniref:Uncharacterized protein n=1 Tax=Cupriavidus metallidurans (strain ATCC 43123 / DSM 2839 / NBRC 102507 / CH34) TaxID=266264 RepID=Q1LHY8_CUPMC|nr:hypothetical protein Rmet_3366 [Cupriavidus metallidurans CH34]
MHSLCSGRSSSCMDVFWHGHSCKEGTREPKSNQACWVPRIAANHEQDCRQISELMELG